MTPEADDRLITTFGRLLEAQSALGQQLGRALEREVGLPHSWFEVLLRISRADGSQVTMSALAEQVALTSGGITRLLDRIIAAGLVERVPCATDRRVWFAALTDEGRAKLDEATAVHAGNLRLAFDGWTDAELRTLDGLLDRVRAARIE